MNWHKWWDEKSVEQYLKFGVDGIPGRREQIDVLLSILPTDKATALRLLDLGCGDAFLLDLLLQTYHNATRAVAVDGAKPMLERARMRLMRHPISELVHGDLARSDWSEELGKRGKFDVIVSGFAIHHIEDIDKRALFARIFDLLAPLSVFINIEHVRSRSPRGERDFERWYVKHLIRLERASGSDRSDEEIAARFRERPGKQANRTALLEDQMRWMENAGFEDVDCIWKTFELAVIVGFRNRD